MQFGQPYRLMFLFIFLVFAVTTVRGLDGRDFSGFYQLSSVEDHEEEIWLTMDLEVFNHSDAAVHNAALVFEDSYRPGYEYGRIPDVYLESKGSIALTTDLEVPRREYDGWQRGATPVVRIEFTDDEGNQVRSVVELIHSPV